MKKVIPAIFLVLVLVAGFFPAGAYAAEIEEPEQEQSAETAVPVEGPAESEPVTNPEGSVLTNTAEGIVYNDGGTVFNNGGIVFNNSGIVYNNNGTVYNNEGTVYTNMGTVYNNGGLVYNNGGNVIENSTAGEVPEENVEADVTVLEEDSIEDEALQVAQPETSEEEIPEDETPKEEPMPPQFGLEAGVYDGAQLLELSAEEGCRIYYTLDGSIPDSNSNEYTEAIEIAESLTVKAFAVDDSGRTSSLAERSFGIVEISIPQIGELERGYKLPPEANILVENKGSTDITVKNLLLEGENADCFDLNRSAGYKIKAGSNSLNFWTVRPIAFLEEGEYKAVLRFVFENENIIEKEIFFKVTAPTA